MSEQNLALFKKEVLQNFYFSLHNSHTMRALIMLLD